MTAEDRIILREMTATLILLQTVPRDTIAGLQMAYHRAYGGIHILKPTSPYFKEFVYGRSLALNLHLGYVAGRMN